MYLFPLLVGVAVTDNVYGNWSLGYFGHVAELVGGPALAAALTLAAAVSQVGMFEAEMSADSYQVGAPRLAMCGAVAMGPAPVQNGGILFRRHCKSIAVASAGPGFLMVLQIVRTVVDVSRLFVCLSWRGWSDLFYLSTDHTSCCDDCALPLYKTHNSNVGSASGERLSYICTTYMRSEFDFQVLGMAERGYLPKVFARRSRFGTPQVGILLSSLGIFMMLLFDFMQILEMLNAIYCLAELLEFAAFLWLRISQPNLRRSYKCAFQLR